MRGACRRSFAFPWPTVTAAMMTLILVAPMRGEDSALEYKVKAGYLFNFAKLVDWPEKSVDADAPLLLGVLDHGEALPVIQAQLAGKKIGDRPIVVHAVQANRIPKDLHVLLVTRTAALTPEELQALLDRAPTLLIGETEDFAERGGVIGFVRDGDTIRLTLNLEHAAKAGLKISSRLASVAKVVKPAPIRP